MREKVEHMKYLNFVRNSRVASVVVWVGVTKLSLDKLQLL